jgi:hypothetical protein
METIFRKEFLDEYLDKSMAKGIEMIGFISYLHHQRWLFTSQG